MISLQHLCSGGNFLGPVLKVFTNHKTINFPYFKERERDATLRENLEEQRSLTNNFS